MLTKRDIEMLMYVKSNGAIIKFGNDTHPYGISELNELVKHNLLIKADHTIPTTKGEYPNSGLSYTLTTRGNQAIDDWEASQAEAKADKALAQKTYAAAKLSIVISVLSLIVASILSILSLIL